MNKYINKRDAYEAIKHEAETHMLPASKEAYERAARIIDSMRSEATQWKVDKNIIVCEQCYGVVATYGLGEHYSVVYKFCPYCGREVRGRLQK